MFIDDRGNCHGRINVAPGDAAKDLYTDHNSQSEDQADVQVGGSNAQGSNASLKEEIIQRSTPKFEFEVN